MKETTVRKYLSTLNMLDRKENNSCQKCQLMLEDDIKPKVFYTLAKLSQYFDIKDTVPQKYKSDLVYKCRVYKLSNEKSHPHVWLDSFQIVGRNYGNHINRKIDEALLINELKPSLNKQDKWFPLKLFNRY